MSGDNGGGPARIVEDTERRLTNRLRYIAVGVMLVMVVLLVIASIAGLHASEVMFATLISAILLLLGVATINKLPGLKS